MKFLLPAAFLIVLFAGCGQSGPLYLPGNPTEVQQPPAETGEDEDEEKDESGEP